MKSSMKDTSHREKITDHARFHMAIKKQNKDV